MAIQLLWLIWHRNQFDVVDKDGVFRGGAISPGIIPCNALFARAAVSSIPIMGLRLSWATPPKALFRQVLRGRRRGRGPMG